MFGLFRKLKLFDVILIIVLFLGGIASSIYIHRGNNGKKMVLVELSGRNYGIYDLRENETIELTGPHSPVVIKIEDGYVYVQESGCPQKVCKRMGKKNRINDVIVCIPNHLIIRIVGEQKDKFEFITQ